MENLSFYLALFGDGVALAVAATVFYVTRRINPATYLIAGTVAIILMVAGAAGLYAAYINQ